MLGCVLLLTLLSLTVNVMWIERLPGSGMALSLFSLDREMSVGTWWSATVLAGLGGLTWLVAGLQSNISRGERLAWWTLTAGFLFLSIDEACMVHERIGGKVRLEGLLHHARWSLLWLPPALLVSGIVLWRLWRTRRHLVIGLSLGIVIYLLGAVCVESVNSATRFKLEKNLGVAPEHTQDTHQSFVPIDWRRDRAYYPYVIGTTIEELLELLGPVVWLWFLLDKRNVTTHRRMDEPATASQ